MSTTRTSKIDKTFFCIYSVYLSKYVLFFLQMNAILGFKNLDNDDKENCLIGDDLRERMNEFNEKLMKQISLVALQESEDEVIYY